MMERPPQRLAGWLLALWFLLLPSPGIAGVASVIILLAGMALRWRRICAPKPIEWIGLAGAFLLALSPAPSFPELLGSVASCVAAVLLLRAVTPRRGLWILLCAVAVLASVALDSSADFPAYALALEVAVLMLLAQQVQAPAGAARGIREILLRSLRLVLPVGLVVTAAFWLFPALSARTNAAIAGFSDGLNPGEFSELRAGRRIAFVATFIEPGPVPSAGDLYWRGAVLEKNDGFRWSQGPDGSHPLFRNPRLPTWRYSCLVSPGRPFAPLDFPVTPLLLPENMQADPGAGSALLVESSASPANDPPVASADLAVPKDISENPQMRAMVAGLFSPGRGVRENLNSLARFLGSSGFVYTLKPGKMGGVAEFLTERRKGFCEHYAAAGANLLRLAGIPARVVTGYRGGRWNPWRRTITVRDSNAHAWIEAWDPSAQHWIRFDPTAAVSPEFESRIETDRDPGRWPWHRVATAFAGSLVTNACETIARATQSVWTITATGLALAVAAAWAFRRMRRKKSLLQIALARLEKYAVRRNLARRPGETPLAWLARLQAAADNEQDSQQLRHFAASYEQAVYRPAGADGRTQAGLAAAAAYFRRRR